MTVRYDEQTGFLEEVNGRNSMRMDKVTMTGLAPYYNPHPINIERVLPGGGGGEKRARPSGPAQQESELESSMRKRPRRDVGVGIPPETLDEVNTISRDKFVNHGIETLITTVFEGGVDVLIGGMLSYPGYDADIEYDLVDQCKRAMRWMIGAGFTPVHTGLQTPGRIVGEQLDSAATDFMYDSDEEESYESQLQRIQDSVHLIGRTLLFHVPSDGMGQFRVYYDMTTHRRKVDFIKTWEDEDDELIEAKYGAREGGESKTDATSSEPSTGTPVVDSVEQPHIAERSKSHIGKQVADQGQKPVTWYVYIDKEPTQDGQLNSPLAQLVDDYKKFKMCQSYDNDATYLATHPIAITQERPPQRDSVLNKTPMEAAGAAMALAGGSSGLGQSKGAPRARGPSRGPPIPRLPGPVSGKSPYAPPPAEARDHSRLERLFLTHATTAAFYAHSTLDIEDGRTFAGLVTPHAYPSIAQRTQEWVQSVAAALSIPQHVLQPSTPSSAPTSVSGAAAGHKQNTSTGARQSKAGATTTGSQPLGKGYVADPIFVTAMRWRHIMAKFFKTIMDVTHGHNVLQLYIDRLERNNDQELEMRNKLIKELEERIEQARKDVISYDPAADREAREQQDIDKMVEINEKTHPPAEKKEGSSSSSPSPATAGKPAAPLAPNQPPSSAARLEGKIPIAESVLELEKRRLEIDVDVTKIRAARAHIEKLKSHELSLELRFRMAIITDTSNPFTLIEALGEQPETSIEVARARAGLHGLV